MRYYWVTKKTIALRQNKLLQIVNKLFIFLYIVVSSTSASAYSQNYISLQIKNTSIKNAFSQIENKSRYIFVFSADVEQELNKKVSIEIVTASIDKIVSLLLDNTDLQYRIVDKQIVVYKGANAARANPVKINITPVSTPRLDPILIKGIVTDAAGVPLSGVSIVIKGSGKGFVTDASGNFTCMLEDKQSYTLMFSYVGYTPKEIVVTGSQNIKVILEEEIVKNTEVVITGFGTKSKNSYTGSQTTVTRKQLLSVGTKNVFTSIQAFVPGMQVVPNNNAGSDPNARPEINIRGRGSFEGAANLPVFVVNGSQVQVDFIYDMDMNDIETATVLKDASASALYGARAAAGVVIITTRALTGGKLRFNYNGTARVSIPDLRDYHLLNAAQKLEYERLAGLYTDADRATQYMLDEWYAKNFQTVRSGVNTNWISKPLQNSLSQNHNISMDGGDNYARYSVGMRYGNEQGVMKGSGRERVSGFFTLSYNKPQALYIANSATVSWVKTKESPYGSFLQYTRLNPYDQPYDANGQLVKELSYKMYNPLYEASIGNFKKGEQLSFINATNLQVWLHKDLRLDGSFSFFKLVRNDNNFLSPFSKDEMKKTDPSDRGSLVESNTKGINYAGKLILSYNKYLTPKLFVTTMGGTNVDANTQEFSSYKSIGYYSDKLAHPSFASKYPLSATPGGGDAIDRTVGFFINANFIQDNKYFLDLIYRYEGSSKFGKNSRFAPFWSVGGGWNLHNERFMQGLPVDRLKLRASIGYLGNISFAPYQSMTTYYYNALLSYTKGQGAVPITIGDPDLKWERTLNKNIGLDLTIFKNRWDLTVDYYVKNTDNLLLDVTKAPSVGVATARQNIGSIENKGLEIQTRVVPVEQQNFQWALSLTFSHNSNKIKSISNALRAQNDKNMESVGLMPLPIYEEGESLTALKVVPSAGIDPATGQEIFIKRNGQYSFVYDARDKVVFGDITPFAYGAFGSYLTYKRLYLGLLFSYSEGGIIYNETLASKVEGSDPHFNADQRVFTERWKQPGDITQYKNIADKNMPLQTSRFVQVNNFLTLQTLSLAYDFSSAFLKNIKLKRARLEWLMNDLFYWSSVKQERGLYYPFAKSMELSLRFSF